MLYYASQNLHVQYILRYINHMTYRLVNGLANIIMDVVVSQTGNSQ